MTVQAIFDSIGSYLWLWLGSALVPTIYQVAVLASATIKYKIIRSRDSRHFVILLKNCEASEIDRELNFTVTVPDHKVVETIEVAAGPWFEGRFVTSRPAS